MDPIASSNEEKPAETEAPSRSFGVPVVVATAVLALLAVGAALIVHAESKTNKVALASSPKPVTVVKAVASTYRPSRSYVGRLDPWVSANVGPQFVAAYVDTVLVRPGASVKKGQVLATLDCRNASATAQAIEMQARALDAQQKALSDEASRVSGLLDGGFVSPNEAEQKTAQSASKEAEVLAEKAKLLGTSLEVNDCILRAPFDGEIATRSIDPGAFARPGTTIVSVVDRSTVRMTADAPETDFDVVSPGTKVTIHAYATNRDLTGIIGRRAPAADPDTRTVRFEIDLADPRREIPVGTTGDVRIDVGEPVAATEIPLASATIRGTKATVFVVDGDVAHKKTALVLGEVGGSLYVDDALKPGERIVTEGRALLGDKDPVTALEASSAPSSPTASSGPKETKP
jgi:RND family efflux transporter MFP subunit